MTADQIIELLDALKERLDGPGRYIFDLAVRQVIIEAFIAWLLVAVLGVGLAILIITARKALRAERSDDYRSRSESDRIFFVGRFTLLGLVFTGLAFFVCLVYAVSALPNLLNPEWAALARIINAIKP